MANPERIQASSAQLDDPVERTAVGALDVLTAAQDTARRHVTASREARAEVSDLLGSVGGEVEAALAQFQRSLADIRQQQAIGIDERRLPSTQAESPAQRLP